MFDILSITLPIYMAIALGYFLVRREVFRPADMPVFGGYVMNIALPALLFNAVASRNLSDLFNLTYMSVFLIGALATIALAYLVFTVTRTPADRRAVAIMGTSCANSGFVGYPVMLLTFPALADQVLALNMLVENFVIIPICLALFELAKPGQELHVLRKTARVILGVLRRPMVLALIAGLIVSVSGLPVPAPLTRFFGMLAATAAALALVVIGGSLVGVSLRGNRALAMQVVLGKLVVHPAMVALALLALPYLGLAPLTPDLRTAAVVSAAIPMFSIYALFAQELGQSGMASIAQILATGGAFLTLNILLFYFL